MSAHSNDYIRHKMLAAAGICAAPTLFQADLTGSINEGRFQPASPLKTKSSVLLSNVHFSLNLFLPFRGTNSSPTQAPPTQDPGRRLLCAPAPEHLSFCTFHAVDLEKQAGAIKLANERSLIIFRPLCWRPPFLWDLDSLFQTSPHGQKLRRRKARRDDRLLLPFRPFDQSILNQAKLS